MARRPAHALPLAGQLPAPSRPLPMALASKGFRPFFLLAGIFAIVLLPLWLLAQAGVFQPDSYLNPTYWHAHEMIFGFAVAVIAGFLLTAAGNWTSRETIVGWPLLALCAVWVLGRLALLFAAPLGRWIPASIDLAFLPLLAIAVGRPIVAAKAWRHLPLLAALTLLWVANIAIHLDALDVMSGWQRRGSLLAVEIVVFVIMVIAGRVFPMFTRNATGVASIRSIPVLDVLAILAMALLVLLDAFVEDATLTAYVAAVTAILAAARSLHWGARHSLRVPLLWVLHIGYAWIPIGLALRAIAAFDGRIPPVLATHALTIGAIGGLTLGMMSRVSLGHTGRALAVGKPIASAFALITLAAIARVFCPLIHVAWYQATIFVSGILWTAAFGLFTVVYVPILLAPRADGKPG